MAILSILLIIYLFLKELSFCIYEYKKNKSSGITILIIAILGLIFPIYILIYFYII